MLPEQRVPDLFRFHLFFPLRWEDTGVVDAPLTLENFLLSIEYVSVNTSIVQSNESSLQLNSTKKNCWKGVATVHRFWWREEARLDGGDGKKGRNSERDHIAVRQEIVFLPVIKKKEKNSSSPLIGKMSCCYSSSRCLSGHCDWQPSTDVR